MLRDKSFSDIYLGQSKSWLAGVPGTLDPVPAPEECKEELSSLREACDKFIGTSAKEEFAIRHRDVAYRVSTLNSMNEKVYVLRRFPKDVPSLDSIGLHPAYIDLLMQPGLTGLLVIAGAFGQGKTTTASAIISSRLGKYGGVGITIEDPPEMPLEGQHGEGVCYQTWVEQGSFGNACRQAARWAPSIIFVGEVRDSETAAEALRASINGRLVVCTTHADSVPMAIERIYSLAHGEVGNADDVSSLLGNGLLGVIHQRLEVLHQGTTGDRRRPRHEFLWLGGNDAQGTRNIIRTRRFEQIGSEVTLQLNRLLMQGNKQGVA